MVTSSLTFPPSVPVSAGLKSMHLFRNISPPAFFAFETAIIAPARCPHALPSPSRPCRPRCVTDGDHTLRILLYSLIFFLSVTGNLLIIVVLTVNKRMRTVTNTFLLSLAVSDLMMAVFCMPFTLIPSILKDFIFGAAMCKIVSYFMGERGRLTDAAASRDYEATTFFILCSAGTVFF